MTPTPPDSDRSASYGGRVIQGSLWSTAQILLNKFATVISTVLFAYYLAPADFGAANIATSLGAFVFVLAPWVFNDLLVSRPESFGRLSGTTVWVSLGFGVVSTIALLVLAPIFQRSHPTVDGLWGLLCVAATRPLADALLSVPWARLRLDLKYRQLAMIDGTLQFAWTAGSVVMAMSGFRALTLVLPPIAVLFCRACIYWRLAAREISLKPRAEEVRPLCQTFLIASFGQYMNNILQIMELLVLGWVASETAVGLFAFAFLLSNQTNAIIGAQISNVLQPVFSRIQQDPERQIAGFLRSIRYMGMFAVPISLIQAAVGPVAFSVLFGEKWTGAIPAFLLLCFAQAFMFLAGPTVVLLKAQGRFRAFFAWQCGQVMFGGSLMYLFWRFGSASAQDFLERAGIASAADAAPSLAVATASALVWTVACPIAIWVGTRPAPVRMTEMARIIIEPWVVSVPIAIAVALAPVTLETVMPSTIASWLCMLIVAPMALLLALAILISREPPLRELVQTRLRRYVTRFATLRQH